MSANKNGIRMSREQRYDWIVKLREQGLTFDQIAAQMGVSRSVITGVYYDPTGEKDRARKAKYYGKCIDCGSVTSYKVGAAAERCRTCRVEFEKSIEKRRRHRWNSQQVWSDEAIYAAIRSAATDGVVSTADYDMARSKAPTSMPSMPLIFTRFGSWMAAVAAAGLKTPRGPYNRTDGLTPAGAWMAVDECEAELGRVPTCSEYEAWARRVGAPCGTLIRRLLGGWSAVIDREEMPDAA